MNEELQKQLVHQLKVLNFWVRLFGAIILIALLIVGYLLLRVAFFIRDTRDSVSSFQQSTSETFDLQKQVCQGSGSFTDFIKNSTDACE